MRRAGSRARAARREGRPAGGLSRHLCFLWIVRICAEFIQHQGGGSVVIGPHV